MFGSGFTTLILSNEEMNNIMKIVKSLEQSGLSVKGISETIKNQSKEQQVGFVGMLLGTLAASILRSALTGRGVIWAGEGIIRTDNNFNAAPSFN